MIKFLYDSLPVLTWTELGCLTAAVLIIISIPFVASRA